MNNIRPVLELSTVRELHGESYTDFRSRILRGLRAAASAYGGQRIVIVTHAGVISQVLGVIRSRAASVWSADRPDPLTATEIIWKDDSPSTLLTYSVPDCAVEYAERGQLAGG